MGESELRTRAEKRVRSMLRGKYRLDSVIGVGGMAAVYCATHRNGNRVAIKMLHLQHSLDDEMRTRFVREGYVANGVDHPGVVRVIDDDIAEDGSVYVVMELLEGETVHERWEKHAYRMPVAEVVKIAVDLLDVLAAAHVRTIVHRDLKPENLFLTREGVLKVLDFGIARWRDAHDSDRALTQTGLTLGTPAFMSPEQALGKRDQIDGRSDLWSAAATLFALLTGRYVHEGETFQEIAVNAATKPAPRLRTLVPHVPEAIAEVIDRALRMAKAERWPSALAMKRAFEDAWAQIDERPLASVSLVLSMPTPEPGDEDTTREGAAGRDEETSDLPRWASHEDKPTDRVPVPILHDLPPALSRPPVTGAAVSSDMQHVRVRRIGILVAVGSAVVALLLFVALGRHEDPPKSAGPPSVTKTPMEPHPSALEEAGSQADQPPPVSASGSSASTSASASKPIVKIKPVLSAKPSASQKVPPKDIFAP